MAREDASLDGELMVLHCSECGDVFPNGQGDDRVCPTCGGANLDPASEPLL